MEVEYETPFTVQQLEEINKANNLPIDQISNLTIATYIADHPQTKVEKERFQRNFNAAKFKMMFIENYIKLVSGRVDSIRVNAVPKTSSYNIVADLTMMGFDFYNTSPGDTVGSMLKIMINLFRLQGFSQTMANEEIIQSSLMLLRRGGCEAFLVTHAKSIEAKWNDENAAESPADLPLDKMGGAKVKDKIEITTHCWTDEVKNNFDSVPIGDVYQHFKDGLVQKGCLTDKEVIEFIVSAFDKRTVPESKFLLNLLPDGKPRIKKASIIKVFYSYFTKNLYGHGKQISYAALLGDYFDGFTTKSVLDNFTRGRN